jgi:hypothetical protein
MALLVVLTASLIGGFWGSGLQATPRTSEDIDKLLKTYTQVLSLAEENYADSVNMEKTLYDSIRGMLQTLIHIPTFSIRKLTGFSETISVATFLAWGSALPTSTDSPPSSRRFPEPRLIGSAFAPETSSYELTVSPASD